MSDPTAFGDPDRIKSANYVVDQYLFDNGGVHSNSGVGNKAAFLMTDGGSFNGYTISGIGITKAATIYYEAQTNLLTTGSDYNDLYNALNQACSNVTGTAGITAADCTEVDKALLAVEMNQAPATITFPTAPTCGAGDTVVTLFSDDFDTTVNSNWTTSASLGSNQWSTYSQTILKFGTGSAYGMNASSATNTTMTLLTPVTVPSGQNTFIRFDHLFSFERFLTIDVNGNVTGSQSIDGGVIEYTTNGGASWNDASGLIYNGQNYNGTVATTGFSNPLEGKSAFVNSSYAYVATRLVLTSLAGQNVLFRFRIGTDTTVADLGWSVDNFKIYNCNQANPQAPVANAGGDITVNEFASSNLNGSGSSDANSDPLFYTWTQIGGPTITLNNAGSATPTFVAPAGPATATFRMDVSDGNGGSDSDTVTVTIKDIDVGLGINDGTGGGGCTVNTNTRFDPVWIILLSLLFVVRRVRNNN